MRPGVATDCSGFVSSVWKNQYGLDLPAHTDAAYNALQDAGRAQRYAQADARPGDVVFYMGVGAGAITHHMGIYAGPGTVLDMSVSGGDGVKVRDVGHGGRFVILRDPRVNQEPARTATAPPPIVPTGVAERTGGERLSQAQVNALSGRPTAGEPGGPPLAAGPVWEPPAAAAAAPRFQAEALSLRQPLAHQPELPPDAGYTDPDQGPRETGYTLPAATASPPSSASSVPEDYSSQVIAPGLPAAPWPQLCCRHPRPGGDRPHHSVPDADPDGVRRRRLGHCRSSSRKIPSSRSRCHTERRSRSQDCSSARPAQGWVPPRRWAPLTPPSGPGSTPRLGLRP